MKKNILLLCLLLQGIVATAQIPAELQVKELTLANGMTVWLNEDHSQPKAYGAVVVKAGAKDCPGTGIAHYFEHIMFKGTDRIGTTDYQAEKPWLDSIATQYDLLAQATSPQQRQDIQQKINQLSLQAADYAIPNEFNRLISRFGGSGLNAATSFDVTFYHNFFLPQYMRQWCWLNSERLLHPVFRLFQGELENVYEEKNRAEDNMGGALEKAQQAIFAGHPYAEPILGSTESLKNPRLSEMAAFFKKYYVARNMGLILCGDIEGESLRPLLEQTFGRLPASDPVQEEPKAKMPALQQKTVDIRLPIPIVKAEALVFPAPTDYERDAAALDLCNKLLYNDKAGLLDSLTNEHRVMAAATMRLALKDAAVQALLVVPRIPFGKMKKAERQCLAQIERIKQGDFSEATLEELKRNELTEMEQELETIDGRADIMLDALSQGQTWQQVLDKRMYINAVSKQDVVAAARKYYTSQYLTLHKKFGTERQETLSQPGYKPVQPKNAGAKSAYAKELEQMPIDQRAIRLVDFEHDAKRTKLSPMVTLYTKVNPINDIFTFTLRFLDGTRHTPLLEPLASYLGLIGTDSLTKQQLEKAWQRMGITTKYEADKYTFALSLTGRDNQLEPALQLLAHLLRNAKADKQALDLLKQDCKVNYKSIGKQNDNVLPPMLARIAYGEASPYLTQTSLQQMKALKSEQLLSLLSEVQQYGCELLYCGKLPDSQVEALARRHLSLTQCSKARTDSYRPTQPCAKEPTVYFYHVPKSRQNLIATYEQLAPATTPQQQAISKLWTQYIGSGMSSVLFQNVREFQSLAYSTHGMSIMPPASTHPGDSLAFVTVTGTQADKTLQAMAVIDSLMRHMPMKEENLEAARQELLSDVQNNYPSFRKMATYIANQRLIGYAEAPDKAIVEQLPAVSTAQVTDFHRSQVAGNHRVWMVIGDRKKTDLKALANYGKIVELKKEDIYK